MRVVQTVFGKFWHFDLARELHRRGLLEAVFSSYPWWVLRHEGIPRDKVRTYPWIHTAVIGAWRLGWNWSLVDRELLWLNAVLLDGYAARHLPDCDVFVGISGSGLGTGAKAKKRGARYICDRGSSHVRYADMILREEFELWGQEFAGIDARVVAKEESEYALADCITVPSEFARRTFQEMGVASDKIRKVPYGVNLSRFTKVGDPPKDTFKVLFVGQVSFRKGLPYLLEAFRRFRHPRKRLQIVGVMQPEMRRFLARAPLDDVSFSGRVPQTALKQIMSTSHVMILPSIEEGLAMVQGQALACGCPVISSVNTGAEDLFEHEREGFIVPIRDVEAIKDCLERFADDKDLRERMGECALKRVQAMGGWAAYGDAFVSVCRELVLN